MMGNGLLALLPVFYLFSNRRPDLPIVLISAYCLVLAGCSALALLLRTQRRMYFWSAISLNALVVMLFVYFFVSISVSGLRNFVAMSLLIVPAVLNLAAVVLVRRSQTRVVNGVAA
jgi:hypothetical protein